MKKSQHPVSEALANTVRTSSNQAERRFALGLLVSGEAEKLDVELIARMKQWEAAGAVTLPVADAHPKK